MSQHKNIIVPLSEEKIILDTKTQCLKNKKIYFDSDWTEIKIGYDEEKWIGFVEIVSD